MLGEYQVISDDVVHLTLATDVNGHLPRTPPDSPEEPFILPHEIGRLGDLIPQLNEDGQGAEDDPTSISSSSQMETSVQPVPATHNRCITMEDLKRLLEDVIQGRSAPVSESLANSNDEGKETNRVQGSKSEYRIVGEFWDEKEYQYKIVDSPPAPKVNELDEFAFVVRERRVKQSEEITTYVDIKSIHLRDVLRAVLKGVRSASLEENKPAVERNLLYHFFPELRDYQRLATQANQSDDEGRAHLDLLIEHLREAYQTTSERLYALLPHGKISYDLLPFLFKPNEHVYITCPATKLPRCIKFYCGKEKETAQGVRFFEIKGHYYDFDGEIFGEAIETVQVESFGGTMRLENLPAYPLQYHNDPTMRDLLVKSGQKFVSDMSCSYRQYHGNMFILNRDRMMKVPADGRIMIDPKMFRKIVPNYPRLETKRPRITDIYGRDWFEPKPLSRVNSSGLSPEEMGPDEFLMCSSTFLGFSLSKKHWGEFAVMNVEEINFALSPYDILNIPSEKKTIVMSLAESRIYSIDEDRADDVIAGKGSGVIILLHGPPGVGKTLTAETIAEDLKRPLYSISAGDLGISAEELEAQLTQIFQLASEWKAILLLDEADVYLQRRDGHQLERNRLVATFLRTLEYYNGIFFLTTNMVNDFDEAILDRVHLKLHYENLDASAKINIFRNFLKNTDASINENELSQFAQVNLNGRQIRNVTKIARNVASSRREELSTDHVRLALAANGHSIPSENSVPQNNVCDNSTVGLRYAYRILPDWQTSYLWYKETSDLSLDAVHVDLETIQNRYPLLAPLYFEWHDTYERAFEDQECHLGSGADVFLRLRDRIAWELQGFLIAMWLALQDEVLEVDLCLEQTYRLKREEFRDEVMRFILHAAASLNGIQGST